MENPRQLAFIALKAVHRDAYADVALERVLSKSNLSAVDRRLVTELVYGSVRRMRSLDALIDRLAKKKSHQQPPDLRTILHLGLYQLCYLTQIPPSAAVNTTVELAKTNGFAGLKGFVNGILRQFIRESGIGSRESGGQGDKGDKGDLGDKGEKRATTNYQLPTTNYQLPITHYQLVEKLGILHSYPNWIIELWLEQLGLSETEQLCEWFNQPPAIDLRVNTLQTSIEQVETQLQAAGVSVTRLPYLPQALRLTGSVGAIQNLPGFGAGWWTVQDSSAQLVSHLLDPQPGEIVIDACAAPGGKTTHIAELMQDKGTIWAGDRTASRLNKLKANAERLQLRSIKICPGDSRSLPQFTNIADRVLLDAPCSGLGTLHRHADARWRQTPASVQELANLQKELLHSAATWVKPGGILVYATCTLHPLENERAVEWFLSSHPEWQIDPPSPDSPATPFSTATGWLKVLPHQHQMDGFFMVRLKKRESGVGSRGTKTIDNSFITHHAPLTTHHILTNYPLPKMTTNSNTKTLVKILIGAAWLDGKVQPEERKYLQQVAQAKNLADDPEIRPLLNELRTVQPTECYEWIQAYLGDRPSETAYQNLIEAISGLIYSDGDVAVEEARLLSKIESSHSEETEHHSIHNSAIQAIQKLYRRWVENQN